MRSSVCAVLWRHARLYELLDVGVLRQQALPAYKRHSDSAPSPDAMPMCAVVVSLEAIF